MSKKYDIVIVGSGIGGLICGNYLVKAGFKTLLIEQHTIPGGYCTSFKRKGFNFDVGVHYLGGIKRGIMGKILREIDVKDSLKLKQYDPVDKFIMPETITYIRARASDTIEEFKQSFPREQRSIDRFFSFITQQNFLDVYRRVKNVSFQKVLDDFFKDFKLKATLSALLGNIGAPASIVSAVSAVILFREYILDPGYYPIGGIQELPNVLVRNYKENGGEIILGHKVTKIITHNNSVKGVAIDKDKIVLCNVVVSNVDATETFSKLLDMKTTERKGVGTLITSPSMVLVYLGLRSKIRKILREGTNLYYFPTYNINSMYSEYSNQLLKKSVDWVICSFPSFHYKQEKDGKETMMILTYAPYKSEKFWERNKETIADKMVSKASELIQGLNDCIELKVSASPSTLLRYTSNRNGAFAGWLPTCSQIKPKVVPQITSVRNLYLVGHWCAIGYLPFGGIPNVAFSGRRAARCITENADKKWDYDDFSAKL